MGTSRKLPGPRGEAWRSANQRLGSWVGSLERKASGPGGGGIRPSPTLVDEKAAQDIAGQYLDALAGTLRDDPDAFGLRDAMLNAGGRLVGMLDSLRVGGAGWFPSAGGDAGDRESAFLGKFVADVAGPGGLIADAAIRRAAAACGEELLSAPGPNTRDLARNGG